MVKNRQATMYSEVYGTLNMLGKTYINSIPKKILNLIEEKRLKEYNPKYNINIPLWKQNISKDATEFICMLHYNYWTRNDKEKYEIDNILSTNQKKRDEYSKLKYNSDNIFKKDEKSEIKQENNVSMIEYKESMFTKIINKIKNIFSKKVKNK